MPIASMVFHDRRTADDACRVQALPRRCPAVIPYDCRHRRRCKRRGRGRRHASRDPRAVNAGPRARCWLTARCRPKIARVPPLDDARLDGMVRGVEFVRERSAPNRYIATLNVALAADRGQGLADGQRREGVVVNRLASGPRHPACGKAKAVEPGRWTTAQCLASYSGPSIRAAARSRDRRSWRSDRPECAVGGRSSMSATSLPCHG